MVCAVEFAVCWGATYGRYGAAAWRGDTVRGAFGGESGNRKCAVPVKFVQNATGRGMRAYARSVYEYVCYGAR